MDSPENQSPSNRPWLKTLLILLGVKAGLILLTVLTSLSLGKVPALINVASGLCMTAILLFTFILYIVAGFSRAIPKIPIFIIAGVVFLWLSSSFFIQIYTLTHHGVHPFLDPKLAEQIIFGKELLWFNILSVLAFVALVYFLRKPMLHGPLPKRSNAAGKALFVLCNFAFLIIFIPLYFTQLAFAGLENMTGGYMTVDTEGMYSVERVFRKGSQEIVLVGMMHIGDRKFYDELLEKYNTPDTAVLKEGVTDRQGLIKEKINYDNVAKQLDLVSQPDLKTISETKLAMIHADIDLSECHPKTIELLNVITKMTAEVESRPQLMQNLLKGDKQIKNEDLKLVFGDILDKRNKHLLNIVKDSMSNYRRLIIPWGALHLADIEKKIIQLGFHLDRSESISIVRFGQSN